jgi:hypothetical protein
MVPLAGEVGECMSPRRVRVTDGMVRLCLTG